ncbi:restriction endonuclease [Streptomyces sp. WI04-05B]|uniref:restriction endonuclease n=1 Tax=Streptomyces TaxID=1883 RepID=UPI0029AB2618|nr:MULTISPECIES: restriction endonuclease [unclassified Streptomyces]MDX2542987.1 restriction endonuclease [Streptomyces sp. WI04-05B]MDX2589435.1 restriction endonuclease [Streptomyces sp. WI04-05A]MDX3747159.1 restriction endonuclease [Streptomyces sp. AK08-02]
MINETALLESKALRDSALERTDVLDKVKALSLLPDGMHVTTAMVAAYFEVAERAVNRMAQRHREELTANGLRILRGEELTQFKGDTLSLYSGSCPQPRSSLAVWSRRAVLNAAMLLRDSDIARQIRTYLLDMEYLARTQPMASPAPTDHDAVSLDDRIDQRITHILGRTVVPMFNALIATSGEHRKELVALRTGVQRIERRLHQHHARLQRLEGTRDDRPAVGVMAAMDAMNGRTFEHHVAKLLRRDGCTNVVVQGGHGDRGVDIIALTADGRRLVVQCKRFAPYLNITSPDMQKFVGSAKVLYRAEVALYVATCPFTPEALSIATEAGITTVHRGVVEEWSAGEPLKVLE